MIPIIIKVIGYLTVAMAFNILWWKWMPSFPAQSYYLVVDAPTVRGWMLEDRCHGGTGLYTLPETTMLSLLWPVICAIICIRTVAFSVFDVLMYIPAKLTHNATFIAWKCYLTGQKKLRDDHRRIMNKYHEQLLAKEQEEVQHLLT
jgi:hypothetical protein